MILKERAKFHPEGTVLHSDLGDGKSYIVEANGQYSLLEQRSGPRFQILGGRSVYPEDFRADEISITDIAHALGMQVRWNGWVWVFYSVGQHSVYVSIRSAQIAKEKGLSELEVLLCALLGLLHDASEAYLGDIVTPLKKELPLYYEKEKIVQDKILEHYIHQNMLISQEITPEMEAIVKQADSDLLFIERDTLISTETTPDPYVMEDKNPNMNFSDINPEHTCWEPAAAKALFIHHYKRIISTLEIANG